MIYVCKFYWKIGLKITKEAGNTVMKERVNQRVTDLNIPSLIDYPAYFMEAEHTTNRTPLALLKAPGTHIARARR